MIQEVTNSLDLDPEWGAIDLFEEVEAAFGIEIANEDAERCATVGDLYELLRAYSPDWDKQNGNCGSSMVFYRIRRSLRPGNKRGLVPDTPLTEIVLSPSQLFKKLADETGLRLPPSEFTWLGTVGAYVLAGGIMATVVALLTGHWMVSGALALFSLTGLPLLRLDPGRFPVGMMTVGDLVGRTVPLNVATLREAGGRPADRWSVLVALAAEYGVLPPDEIGSDTVFHRAQLKSARG